MKPFFKWSGGKRREIKRIRTKMPEHYNTYYEPFLGGGAVWLDLDPDRAVVGDSYSELINFFHVLKTQTAALVEDINNLSVEYQQAYQSLPDKGSLAKEVERLKKELKEAKKGGVLTEDHKEKKKILSVLSKELKREFQEIADKFYYPYRDTEPATDYQRALRFYILRQLSFSGMLRFGAKGNFNVPFGWYKSLTSLSTPQPEIERVLKNATILNCHWKQCVGSATKDDFVFLDPPYTRKFTKYHPNGEFMQEQHIELATWFETKQAQAMIIINKDDFTTQLYDKFIKEEYGHKYSIQYRDRMKEEDSNAVHILATNYKIKRSKKLE